MIFFLDLEITLLKMRPPHIFRFYSWGDEVIYDISFNACFVSF